MPNGFVPDKKYKFTFGLWTVGNPGRDPFGGPTRPTLSVGQICDLLGDVGAYGVNFHDNDLIPIDATPQRAAEIKKEFRKGLKDNGLTGADGDDESFFSDPVFKDGAFTSNNAKIRAYAIQKTMHAMDLGAEFGAKIYVFWGGREGTESDATKSPVDAIKRFREAIELPLPNTAIEKNFGYKLRIRSKAERAARAHLLCRHRQLPRVHSRRLNNPDMCGVNPEFAHESHGRPELRPPSRCRARGEKALPHRPQRSGVRPVRPGLPLRHAPTRSTRSSSLNCSKTTSTTAPATSTATRSARAITRT